MLPINALRRARELRTGNPFLVRFARLPTRTHRGGSLLLLNRPKRMVRMLPAVTRKTECFHVAGQFVAFPQIGPVVQMPLATLERGSAVLTP